MIDIDSIPHDLLLAKLKGYGLSDNCSLFIRSYLSGRFQRVKVGDSFSAWTSASRGIPQGSVLGPLLFNVFLNDLFFIQLDFKLSAYADDIQLFRIGKEPFSIHPGMVTDLTAVAEWFSFNGLAVNVDKCFATWLGDCSENPSFHLNNHEISSLNKLKLLGFTIDKDLNFSSHVSNIVRKVSN